MFWHNAKQSIRFYDLDRFFDYFIQQETLISDLEDEWNFIQIDTCIR
ncbi:MAG: hypothetical protein RJA53_1695 [Bacteroidota bacterium]|jgi:hypothetical protein